MLITNTLIEAGKSDSGAWSRKQLGLIGVPWPPLRGWRSRIVGEEITQEDADKFIAIRNCHLIKKYPATGGDSEAMERGAP